jgi:outer membrane protein assembly factor BamB
MRSMEVLAIRPGTRTSWLSAVVGGAVLGMLLLSGCAGSSTRLVSRHATSSPTPTPNPGSVKWSFTSTDQPVHNQYFAYTGPIITDGLVYFTSIADDKIFAVNAADGTLKWSAPGGEWVPVVADGLVYAVTKGHVLYAYGATTGVPRWTFHDDAFVTFPYVLLKPVVVNDTLYALGTNGVYALNAADGTRKWVIEGLTAGTPLEVVNGVLFVVFAPKGLSAYNASTGAKMWAWPQIDSYVAGADGMVYITNLGTLLALNAADAKRLWSLPISGQYAQAVVQTNGLVYVLASSGTFAFNTSDGTLKWHNGYGTPAVVVDGTLYQHASDGMCAFSATDGSKFWCSPATYDGFTVANGAFYGASEDSITYKRSVVALNASNGTTLWTAPTLSDTTGTAPQLAGGVIYWLTNEGRLYAINA